VVVGVVAVILVAFAGLAAGVAHAAWVTSGTGVSAARAATTNGGNAPTANVSGRTVSLSWATSTYSNGGVVPTYLVKRYNSAGTVVQTISSGTCATTVTGTSCSETAVPAGSWKYAVTPAVGNWRGAESAQTAAIVGANDLSLAPTLTRATATLTGTIANFITGETLTFRLDNATSGTVLAGTLTGVATPTTVPSGGGGGVTVVLPAGTTAGAHTVYAVTAPSAENASQAITVDNTPPPAPSITGSPANPTALTSATFTFTDTEPGVALSCSLDSAPDAACTSPKNYTGLTEGTHSITVTATDAAGNTATATSSWTIDFTAPTGTVTSPVNGSSYNATRYAALCGTSDLCGTAADGGSGVQTNQISVQSGTGNYWNGTAFASATAVLLPTGGAGAAWNYTLAVASLPDGPYTERLYVTDNAGNVSAAIASTWKMDRVSPTGSPLSTTNAGTNGKPELGDAITFAASEPLDPTSILAGWMGTTTNVVVRITDGGAGVDTLTVWNSSNTVQLSLGSVNLQRTDYVTASVTFGLTGTASSMLMTGSTVKVTLGTPSDATKLTTAATPAKMRWTPSATATDMAGNAMPVTAVDETDNDRDF
jgi:hypothetical protein